MAGWLAGWLTVRATFLANLLDMVWASIHFSADRFVLQLEIMDMGMGLFLWRWYGYGYNMGGVELDIS